MKVVGAGAWRRVDMRVKLVEKAKEAIIQRKAKSVHRKDKLLEVLVRPFSKRICTSSSNLFILASACLL
jgi:hypothetical protein